MTNASGHLRARLLQLRSIGWTVWNPIGLSRPGPGEAGDDEYDNYLLALAGRLERGGSPADAVSFLIGVEQGQMGLSPAGDATIRAQATVAAIQACLASPGPGTSVED